MTPPTPAEIEDTIRTLAGFGQPACAEVVRRLLLHRDLLARQLERRENGFRRPDPAAQLQSHLR